MDLNQLILWCQGKYWNSDDVLRCPDCGVRMTEVEQINSLWGRCRDCENERLSDVVAG